MQPKQQTVPSFLLEATLGPSACFFLPSSYPEDSQHLSSCLSLRDLLLQASDAHGSSNRSERALGWRAQLLACLVGSHVHSRF